MGHLSNGDKTNMLCYFRHAHDIALQWILHYPSFAGLLLIFVDNLASLDAGMGI